MQWNKQGQTYVSDAGYTLTKTPGRRWVVCYGTDLTTPINGEQFRRLDDAKAAAEFHFKGFPQAANPVVIPMPPEPDKSTDSEDNDPEDTPIQTPQPEPPGEDHGPGYPAEPDFAAPTSPVMEFSPHKREFIHPNDPDAAGSIFERLDMVRDTMGVAFKTGSGIRCGRRLAG